MSSLLTFGALAAALLACLFWLELWPFQDWRKGKGPKRPRFPISDRAAAKHGFGRRTR